MRSEIRMAALSYLNAKADSQEPTFKCAVADLPDTTHCGHRSSPAEWAMISFRLPWYTLGFGLCSLLTASLLSISETIRWPIFLAGGLLSIDGGLGLRTLPALVPFASFPEDWRQIERELYFGQVGMIRSSAAVLACTCFAFAGLVFPKGDWQIWSVVSLMAASAIGWALAALMVIRQVLGNGN